MPPFACTFHGAYVPYGADGIDVIRTLAIVAGHSGFLAHPSVVSAPPGRRSASLVHRIGPPTRKPYHRANMQPTHHAKAHAQQKQNVAWRARRACNASASSKYPAGLWQSGVHWAHQLQQAPRAHQAHRAHWCARHAAALQPAETVSRAAGRGGAPPTSSPSRPCCTIDRPYSRTARTRPPNGIPNGRGTARCCG